MNQVLWNRKFLNCDTVENNHLLQLKDDSLSEKSGTNSEVKMNKENTSVEKDDNANIGNISSNKIKTNHRKRFFEIDDYIKSKRFNSLDSLKISPVLKFLLKEMFPGGLRSAFSAALVGICALFIIMPFILYILYPNQFDDSDLLKQVERDEWSASHIQTYLINMS